MAQSVDKDIYNAEMYKKQFDKSSKDELSFFDELANKIKHKIITNRQITINNINATNQSLKTIRQKAKDLTDSIIQHDDNMVIKKQEMIDEALNKIHHQLFEVYQHEMHQVDNRVFSIEHLHNRLVDSNLEYFTTYKYFLSGMIENIDDHHQFLKQKGESINYTIDKHFKEIYDEFTTLNQKITEIDDEIKQLITIKSHKEDILDEFFDIEIRKLTEEQINFNINEDPYSKDIKDLTKKKQTQFKQFRKHLHYQEDRLLDMFRSEIEDLFDSFYHENYQKTYSQEKAETYAKHMLKPIIKEKKYILHQYKKDNLKSIDDLKKSLALYQKLYKTDPFLAQLFFDDGSREISNEIDFARLYKMNKSLKYHIYYTYKLAQLNHKIKIYEYQFVHFLENKFISQEIDIVNILKDIKSFLIDNQSSIDASKLALKRDKHFIIFLSQLIDANIDHQIQKENMHRKYLSEFTRIFRQNVHQKVDTDIQLLNHSSDIRLALKESEIDTIHFKHLYENEKRLLLIQQNRIQSETDINYELITTTFLNQMRFAKEQIKLAEEEFKLRLSVIAHNIDSERIHYYEMINYEVRLKDEEAMSRFNHYQKKVYNNINEFEHTDNKRQKIKLEKELQVLRDEYRQEIDHILEAYRNNSKIQLYKKRLQELDMYLEDAYLSASDIRDKTIEEMDENYRLAEEKYNDVIESIDKDRYPLDDVLYESLQNSKKRLNEKMLYAEMTLDEKVGDAIDSYKKLYFKLNQKFDSKPLLQTLEQFQKDSEQLEINYQDQLDEINDEYQMTIESYNSQIRQILNHYQHLLNQNTKEKNNIIQQKTSMINDKDALFNDFIKQIKHKHQKELNQLVESYLMDVQVNHKMNDDIHQDYQILIDSYEPYIKYSKKSRSIKKLVKKTIKTNRKQHRRHLRKLKKEIKHTSLK